MSVVRKSRGALMTYDPATRWRARAWALIAYLLVLAAVGAIVLFALRYQPISAANFASQAAPQSDPKIVRVGYVNGGTFSFGFLIVNDGPLPVKIQRIHITGRNQPLVPTRLETAGKRYAGSLGQSDPSLEKFLPFTLGGGDARWIVVRTRFGNCGGLSKGAFEITHFEVTYTVLGLTKHAQVSLPRDIRVDSPPNLACPTLAA
jgi:hypothetical protein